jgi:hypothetical protein
MQFLPYLPEAELEPGAPPEEDLSERNAPDRFLALMHSLLGSAGVCLALAMPLPSAAQDDPMAAVAEQAAVLQAAPRLSSGTLEVDAESLSKGAFVWLEVERDGLYTLSLLSPGTLVLGSIPTVDGRYDGQTAPVQHASAKSHEASPGIGPLLLTSAFPYLLSVSSEKGPARLSLELIEPVPDVSPLPKRNAPVADGDSLFETNDRVDLVLPGSDAPRRIEIVPEPRASMHARLNGRVLPDGGIYPWVWADDASLWFTNARQDPSPPARFLVRVLPESIALDETEPNDKAPSALSMAKTFRGILLPGDEDRLGFMIEAPISLSIRVEAEPPQARFTAQLSRIDGASPPVLWTRKPDRSVLDNELLTLTPGEYWLDLQRNDSRPGPAPYTVLLEPANTPDANQEVEPNDIQQAAMQLPDSYRVSGHAEGADRDYYRFTIPGDKAEHLWRLFVVDATMVKLFDQDGAMAEIRPTGRRSLLDALALNPGDYWVSVGAEGDYLLRVIDQGPRPSDYEGEPNDKFIDGQRIEFGKPIRGGFHREGDVDNYLFSLDVAGPVEILIRPASEGPMDVKLYLGNHQVGQAFRFDPGDGPYAFRSNLTAGDWSLVFRSLAPSIQDTYEVGLTRLPALVDSDPGNEPLDATKLPRDGDIGGTLGGFDGTDQVFVALPEGQGSAVIACRQDREGHVGRWAIYDWAEGRNLSNLAGGLVVFDYGPELGGAVRLGLDGAQQEIGYQCGLRFPPDSPPGPVLPSEPGDTETTPLKAGETRRVTISDSGPEPSFSLQLEAGEFGFVSCRDARGTLLAPDLRVWRLEGVQQPVRQQLAELVPFVVEDAPLLKLSRSHAQRMADGALPMDVDCALYALDDLRRPTDMGPPAPFQIVYQASDTEPTDPGPPPPGLEALLAMETPSRQPEGDLPITITLNPLPELAAFRPEGQRFEVSATLVSEASTALEAEVAFDSNNEGWTVSSGNEKVQLPPGATIRVSAEVAAPPWLRPALSPGITITVSVDESYATALADVPLSVMATPQSPFTHWQAPEALRGGLNVLHYGLGARLIDWGGKTFNELEQKQESGVHDGLAPHIFAINVPRELTFRLAATAELAGIVIQTRSTTSPEQWPVDVAVSVPEGVEGWRRVAVASLQTVHTPQYVVFDVPVQTDRLRFEFDRCHVPCNQSYLQEIQAIAVPGSHPEGLPPINAADIALGGHVVWANTSFGGAWNSEFLLARPEASSSGWHNVREPTDYVATVAFHHNRAALLQAVEWVGHPNDDNRIDGSTVEASLSGPAGPWTPLGHLPSPPASELRSRLTFEQPVWVRFLRFTFAVGGDAGIQGPDTIQAIEVTGTSVLGLWEDDQPRAAYEAVHDVHEPSPAPPAGGPDRDSAIALPMESSIDSSVLI